MDKLLAILRGGGATKRQGLAWAAGFGAAAAWSYLIVWIHRDSPRTLVSFHGFLHSAIVERFVGPNASAFPPENPFFAGEPVAYYWFFQFLAAQFVRLLDWNPFYALEAIIVLCTGILVVVAVRLGFRLYNSIAAGLLIGYLVFAGTNPLGFVFGILKIPRYYSEAPAVEAAAPGTVGGDLNGISKILEVSVSTLRNPIATLERYDDPEYLWRVVHPLYSLIRFNDFGGLYGPLMNFFLNVTSRPAALASLLCLVFFLERSLRRPTLPSYVGVASSCALTTAFSPIVGLGAGGALCVPLLVCWLRRRSHRTNLPDAFRGACVAIGAGILAAAPTYYHLILGPSQSEASIWLTSREGLGHLATVALSVGPLLALAFLGLRRSGQAKPFLRVLVFAAAILLVANAAVSLPSGNGSNFFHAAVVLLAVPAAGAILGSPAAGKGPTLDRLRLGTVVLVFLPTLVLLLLAYVHRPPIPLDLGETHTERIPDDDGSTLLYSWIRARTSPETVFVTDPRNRQTPAGNISEFPTLAGRMLFTEDPEHYVVSPYPDSVRRHRLAVDLVSAVPAGDGDTEYLSSLGRPLYILSYQARERAVTQTLESLYGPPLFRQGEFAVFEWHPLLK